MSLTIISDPNMYCGSLPQHLPTCVFGSLSSSSNPQMTGPMADRGLSPDSDTAD